PRRSHARDLGSRLGKHLLERLHLDAGEDALRHVGVAADDRPHLGERVGLEDDQATGTIEERSGELDAPGARERTQVREMRGAAPGPLLARVRRVAADGY